jgi:hypothetical protein
VLFYLNNNIIKLILFFVLLINLKYLLIIHMITSSVSVNNIIKNITMPSKRAIQNNCDCRNILYINFINILNYKIKVVTIFFFRYKWFNIVLY